MDVRHIEKDSVIKFAALSNEEPERPKDRWDKFASLSMFLSSVVIGAIGLIFTYVNARQEAANREVERRYREQIEKIQTLERFLPHLSGSEAQKKAALAAVRALGYRELATELAANNQGPGAVQFLQNVATGETGKDANAAVDALKRIGAAPTTSSGPTPAEALRAVSEKSRDTAVQKQAENALADLFKPAQQSTVIVAGEFHTTGFVVEKRTVIASTVILDFMESRKRVLPLVVRPDDGSSSPSNVIATDRKLRLIALNVDRDPDLPPLVPFTILNALPEEGTKVWIMATAPNAPFQPVPGVVRRRDGSYFYVKADGVSSSAGVFAGAPVITEQNRLIGMYVNSEGSQSHECLTVPAMLQFIENATQPSSGLASDAKPSA